ncbi:MAG: hypothetical protein KC996_03285 [Phycisphaerales bacterium]|nr:hypothetical protein [Phycisphaerales bacterium]
MRTPRPNRALTRVLTLGGALLGAAALNGCVMKNLVTNSPSGQMRSRDAFTYQSTPFEPLSVTLYDNRDKEPLWTVDVPVGKKVTIRFLENRSEGATARRPDIMQWEIYDDTMRRSSLSSTMAVPGAESRLLKVTLRDGPEYPVELEPAPSFPDPARQWDPVQQRKFRGVSTDQTRSGTYYAD